MKRIFAIGIVAVSAVALTGCSLLYPNWDSTLEPSDPQVSETPSQSATPTQQPSESSTPTATPKIKNPANVVITDSGVDAAAGVVYAVAEITNRAENVGACSLTFTGAGVTKTVTAKAEANVNRTECFPLQISLKGLPKGAGLLWVGYESETLSGTTKAIGVVIP